MKTVTQSTVNEIKDLVESGDINLDEMRARLTEATRSVTDEQLLICIAAQQDDDDEELQANADAILKGELKVE